MTFNSMIHATAWAVTNYGGTQVTTASTITEIHEAGSSADSESRIIFLLTIKNYTADQFLSTPYIFRKTPICDISNGLIWWQIRS